MSILSVQRILGNHTNTIREAVIAATTLRAATQIRLLSQSRQGRGSMQLTGPFTGDADRTLEIEILSGTGAALRPSTPVIRGVGNGPLTITGVEASAVPETVTFTLVSQGDAATAAELPFAGVTLRAKATGAAGNALTLSVTRNLTLSDPIGATLADLSAGTSELPDARWDFGATPATASTIPLNATRIQFDGYPTVHRHWRAWVDGAWAYFLDPALPYAVPADTAIRAVTGDYTLTLTDGTTTETYTTVTVYGFLTAIQGRSALVEVIGTVAADAAPGGMAVTDISLRTDAYALPVIAHVQGAYGSSVLEGLTIAPDAVTENLIVTARANTALAPASWSVVGAASGVLPDAVTGVPYAHGPVAFTIPDAEVPAEVQGRIFARTNFTSRGAGESLPSVCVEPLALGARASAKSITFVYTPRSTTAGCDCTAMSPPRLSFACLGLAPGGSDMALDPDYQSRLADLYDWRGAFMGGQSDLSPPAEVRWAAQDMDLCDQITMAFADTLALIYTSGDALAGWDAALSQMQSELAALEDGLGEPAAELAAGLTVGTLARHPLTGVLYRLARVVANAAAAGDETPAISASMTVGTAGVNPLNSGVYQLINATSKIWQESGDYVESAIGALTSMPALGDFSGTVGDTFTLEKTLTWNSEGYPLTKETSTWVYQGPVQTLSLATELGALTVVPRLDSGWSATPGATTTTTTTTSWTDGTPALANTEVATWTSLGLPPDLRSTANVGQLVRRYQARLDALLPLAGLVPKSDASSTGGDGCWRDLTDASAWWVDASGGYLPAFTNEPYVSCVLREGAPATTQEFGFAILTPCPERLKAGDSVTITIDGAMTGAYAEGDTFTIPLVGAAPAPFTGGAAGSTVQTWAVAGSVGGAYPDWAWDPSDPGPYAGGPLDATLTAGGIPFEVGDTLSVALEGGELRWRDAGGTWTEGDLSDAHDLADGLTLTAVPGASPSFVAGDTWTFRASATYGPDQLRQPRDGAAFAWDGETVTLEIDLGSVQPLECLLIALHTLPSTATIEIQGGDTDTTDWTVTPDWSAGPLLIPLPADTTARYLEITIAETGSGAEIGWLWAGVPWRPTTGVSSLQHIRQYGLTRGSGRNPSALYSGRGTGGRWAWSISDGGALPASDVASLTTLLDHVAEQGLEWVCLVPDITHPESATLAQIDADQVTFTEELGYYLDGAILTSVDLPFRAVLR